MDQQLFTIESDTKNYNIVKEIVLCKLRDDKIITEEQAKEYTEKWQIIVFKRSWFERWVNAFSKNENKDSYQIKYVKFET